MPLEFLLLLMMVVMVVVVVLVEEMEVEAAFHRLLLGLQTRVLDSLPFHPSAILELEVQLVMDYIPG